MCTEVAEVRPAEQALAHFACACEENRARAVAQCFRVWCQLAAEEQREQQLSDQAQTLRHLLFGRRAVTHWRAATRKALTVYTRVFTSDAACVGRPSDVWCSTWCDARHLGPERRMPHAISKVARR